MKIQISEKGKYRLAFRLPTGLLTSKMVCFTVINGLLKDRVSKDDISLIVAAIGKLRHGYSGFELVYVESADGSKVKIIL